MISSPLALAVAAVLTSQLQGGPPAGGQNATCAALQSCSYVKGRGCQCNFPECQKYNDCCPDVQRCVAHGALFQGGRGPL
jgi:hypothetical protein